MFSEKIMPHKNLERQSIQPEAMTLYAAITEPHPRLSQCKPAVVSDARTPDKSGSLQLC